MLSRFIIIFSLLSAFLFTFEAYGQETSDRALEIYFVRHAETESNRTHIHSQKNDRTFSAAGIKQVAALTEKLSQHDFDYILVSPKYRALNTILPYLKKIGKKAEIWPELEECCWQKRRYGPPSSYLKLGERIKLEARMKPYFKFRDHNSSRRYKTRSYADGIAQMILATDMIRKKFGQSGKKILIVSHYHAGSRIIEILQGLEPAGHIKLSNAKITYLKEIERGRFKVISRNR